MKLLQIILKFNWYYLPVRQVGLEFEFSNLSRNFGIVTDLVPPSSGSPSSE